MALIALAVCGWLWRERQRLLARLAAQQALFAEQSRAERARVRQQTALEERERIHRDLHDDLGSHLLQMIYTAPSPEHADQARAALQNLRDVVSRSRGEPGRLSDVLADIEAEARQRLWAVEAELVWEQADGLPDPQLDSGQALHLHRIVREGISNAIRHAKVRRLRLRARPDGAHLLLDVTDDGFGTPADLREGRGMDSMRSRAAELKGQIDWTPGTQGGTKIVLRFPLPEGGP
ncbi:sensor histidine kinase [Aquimonas voraii]|uniref:sensor histidine kinase n=1 Tax=Aquimonas voraii TaxID=265719 RepID=UPI001C408EFB|nr:ATP-binding protein [Aquimonas voraii]